MENDIIYFSDFPNLQETGTRKDNGKLNHRIEEIKTINRAKCLLMENGKMSEQDAHRFLEKKAMDTQQTRLQIANAVIRRYHRR